MDLSVHFSTGKDDWETPGDFFASLNQEFDFLLDVAAAPSNAKLPAYYTEKDNALIKPWAKRNWCNPPYSDIRPWIEKAAQERANGNLTVMLIPARTDTRAFHDHIYNQPKIDVRFVRGRLKFVGGKHCAPFPSMIVIFRP
jgi:site-specific DNA-methyltransferase (adenine-specific)